MIDGELSRASGLTTWLSLFAALWLTSCTTTVHVANGKSPVEERRTRLWPKAPLLSASWQVEPRAITGEVTWTPCRHERRWSSAHVRTTRHAPSHTLGWMLLAVGGGANVGALVAWDPEIKSVCHGPFQGDCHFEKADNTAAAALLVTSAVAYTGSMILFLSKPRQVEERLNPKQHHVVETAACVPARDLAELVLVLKVGQQYWPVRLDEHGRVQVLVPTGVDVPRDVDLELVVYRAPRGAAQLPMHKGQVLDSLRLEPDGPSPDPSADP